MIMKSLKHKMYAEELKPLLYYEGCDVEKVNKVIEEFVNDLSEEYLDRENPGVYKLRKLMIVKLLEVSVCNIK